MPGNQRRGSPLHDGRLGGIPSAVRRGFSCSPARGGRSVADCAIARGTQTARATGEPRTGTQSRTSPTATRPDHAPDNCRAGFTTPRCAGGSRAGRSRSKIGEPFPWSGRSPPRSTSSTRCESIRVPDVPSWSAYQRTVVVRSPTRRATSGGQTCPDPGPSPPRPDV